MELKSAKPPFLAEVDLAPPVERWLASRGSLVVVPEIEGDYGIADLVAGFGDPRRLRNRRRQSGPVLNAFQLDLLNFCSTWRTEQELRSWAPFGWSSLRTRLVDPLVAQNLLRIDGLRFRSVTVPKDPFDSVIAVELKLRDAWRGLEQANSYRVFADASYLAMPVGRYSDELIETASRCQIGLLAIAHDHVDEVLAPGSEDVPSEARRRHASEKILDAQRGPQRRRAGSPIYSVSA
jgi:hypothetical protein